MSAFKGWTERDVEAHNQRVRVGGVLRRVRGNPQAELPLDDERSIEVLEVSGDEFLRLCGEAEGKQIEITRFARDWRRGVWIVTIRQVKQQKG